MSLEQSCHELQNTAVELEKRLKMIDEESMLNFHFFVSLFEYWKNHFKNKFHIVSTHADVGGRIEGIFCWFCLKHK